MTSEAHESENLSVTAFAKKKILLIEDNGSDARLVEVVLERSSSSIEFEMMRGETLAEGLQLCRQHSFSVILLDLGLSDSFGIETLEAILPVANCAIIVLSGMKDEELAINALSRGAQDYLMKDELRERSISRSIRYAIERFRLVKDLERERRKAEAANRAKSEFLSIMSHEFRTPMNGIVGGLEYLKAEPASAESQEVQSMMSECAFNQLELINDVLDLSKIESDSLELNFGPVCLSEVIYSVVSTLGFKADSKSLQIESEIAPEVPNVFHSDARRVRQILLNLVGNAVKFSKSGTIKIRVERGAKDRLIFSVEDKGIGIVAENLDSIFEPFTQVDGSYQRVHQGSGLGLAICKRLTHILGGEIWVRSEFGRGSTFFFTIRAGSTEAEWSEDGTGDLGIDSRTTRFADLYPMDILIVDDNDSSRFVLERAFSKLGYKPCFAGDGEEAITIADAASFDLVLMDLQLPKMDGLEATRVILERAREQRPLPYISAMSSSSLVDDQSCLVEMGLDDVMVKPILHSELVSMIKTAYARRYGSA